MQTYRLIGVAYPSATAARKHSGSLRNASKAFGNLWKVVRTLSGSFRTLSKVFRRPWKVV